MPSTSVGLRRKKGLDTSAGRQRITQAATQNKACKRKTIEKELVKL